MNIEIKKDWLNATVGGQVCASGGFLNFQDGGFECVLMWAPSLGMRIIHRTTSEKMRETITAFLAGNPRVRLVTNGSWYIPTSWGMATNDPNPTIFGNVVDASTGLFLQGSIQQGAACFCMTAGSTPLGEPPTSCTAGIGGLVPLMLSSKAVDDKNKRYADSKQYMDDPQCGRQIVALTKDSNYLLVMMQRNGGTKGLTHDQMRDKLADAEFGSAAMPDGSTSVLMTLEGVNKIEAAYQKNETQVVALGFVYDLGLEPHTISVDVDVVP